MFFQNPLKGRQDWYFYILGIVLVIFMYILGQMPLTIVALNKIKNDPNLEMDAFSKFQESMDFTIFGIGSNYGFLLALFIFIFAFIGLAISVSLLHRRSLKSLINWSEKIDWKRILWAFSFWMLITELGSVIQGILSIAETIEYAKQNILNI